MSDDFEDDEGGPKWWVWALVGCAGLGAVGLFVALSGGSKPPPPRKENIMHVALPPPPPPPKKPPEPEPVKTPEPQKIEQAKPSKVIENKPAQKPSAAPAGPALTAAAGAGTNAYGLAVGNGGGGTIGGGGGGGGGGSRFGAYAGQIQARIEQALQQNEKTRSGKYLLSLALWLSPTGQVIRVKVAAGTGDPALDAVIEQVVGTLAIGQAPPADMPQPVNLQVRARVG